jgi:hypothetical protein
VCTILTSYLLLIESPGARPRRVLPASLGAHAGEDREPYDGNHENGHQCGDQTRGGVGCALRGTDIGVGGFILRWLAGANHVGVSTYHGALGEIEEDGGLHDCGEGDSDGREWDCL